MSSELQAIIENSSLIRLIESNLFGDDIELRRTFTGKVFILQTYAAGNGFEIYYPERSQDLQKVMSNFFLYVDDKPVCLNFQTVGNLKKYLEQFPNDFKVVIHSDYKTRDCVIACNYENQIESKTVQLIPGAIDD